MAKKKVYHFHAWRRVVQVISLVLLNPYFYVVHRGLCFPAMNCWACPAAAFGCPVGGIGNMLAYGAIPFLTVGITLLLGALIGRMICGWVCPFGLLQDLMVKIPFAKFKLPKAFSYLKYVLLVMTVFAVPMWLGTDALGTSEGPGSPAFFCTYCPAGTLEAAVPDKLGWTRIATENVLNLGAPAVAEEGEEVAAGESEPADDPFAEESDLLGGEMGAFGGGDLFGEEDMGAGGADWIEEGTEAVTAGASGRTAIDFFLTSPRMWVLYGFLLLFIMTRRPFCRGVCPIGAMFALLNRFSLFRVRVRKDKCKSCNLCAKTCPVSNKVYCTPSSDDCVRCLECVDTCKRGGVEAGLISVLPREDYWE